MITPLPKKKMVTARLIPCPKCGSRTYVNNQTLYGYDKIRYRTCRNCGNKFRTIQDIRAKSFPETIVPYEELSEVRQRNYIHGGGNSKLVVSDIIKIRTMWSEAKLRALEDGLRFFPVDEKQNIAEEFGVTYQTIHKILKGKAWAFVP